MNKLSKILLIVTVILSIALILMTFSYFKMKKTAQDNLAQFLKTNSLITLLMRDYPELQSADLEALKNEVNQSYE